MERDMHLGKLIFLGKSTASLTNVNMLSQFSSSLDRGNKVTSGEFSFSIVAGGPSTHIY